MSFGLCNAPVTFERLMEKVLQGLLWKICLVYLDDIIIYQKNFEEMFENVKKYSFVYVRQVNLKKCVFLRKKVKYLGHVVTTTEDVTTDPEKISAVKN